jgi:hypothetical protein
MEAVNIVNNFEEVYEDYEQESRLLPQSAIPEEILQSDSDPLRFCKGLFFALPIGLLMWGLLMWAFL